MIPQKKDNATSKRFTPQNNPLMSEKYSLEHYTTKKGQVNRKKCRIYSMFKPLKYIQIWHTYCLLLKISKIQKLNIQTASNETSLVNTRIT